MMRNKKIKTALVSVFYKEGLDLIIRKLDSLGVRLISTGGTHRFIEELGIGVEKVEDLTSYPSILGGRVKTLHPRVFGGILARRDNDEDLKQLAEYDIPEIDLVIVDLYPFEETLESGAGEEEIIEKIDIGGISLIRAAAKNFADTLIISGREQYGELAELLERGQGVTTLEDRKYFATLAFDISSHYDTAIFNYFNSDRKVNSFRQSFRNGRNLRYGENPHQHGSFFGNFDEIFARLHGKEISYNNILDIDAAVNLIAEFDDTTVAILKHNNACGLASRDSLVDAWKEALAGDPVSAYGGIVIANREIDQETAMEVDKLFFEVIIAPAYNQAALELLKGKKNRIILLQKKIPSGKETFRSVLNGTLWQEKDMKTEKAGDMTTVTVTSPGESQYADLEFANKIVKHTKSNCIVLAGNRQLFGSGVGMTSRVDALKFAIDKAKSFGFNLGEAVMASDAFFPFSDSVEMAHREGIKAVIQPGGSVRDNDSIDYCNRNGMAMVFTGVIFRH
ncbi:MAG: bifunctional phosphoribosylaminoimidazolecarboxamide formyltransferase/IMP cyclohydrolase [Bacteroidales bacterium]